MKTSVAVVAVVLAVRFAFAQELKQGNNAAAAQTLSVSAWIRQAALEKLAAARTAHQAEKPKAKRESK